MIAILGSGISGLSAAYQLKKANKEFIILEAEAQIGGKIRSTNKQGYILEHGPNTVLINNKETKDLLEDLQLWDELIFPEEDAVKSRFVLKNGSVEPIPTNIKEAFKSKLFTSKTLLSIFSELLKKKKETDEEESLADFARRRFGKQIFEDFITPFITGIYAGDPEKMSIDYTMTILKEAEQQHGSVLKGMVKIMKEKKALNERDGLPKQKIFSFQLGIDVLIKKLEDELKEHVSLNSPVTSIELKEGKYLIHYLQNEQQKTIEVEQVIAALPAHVLSTVCANLSSTLSNKLKKINYVPAVALHFGLNSSQIKFKSNAFGILSRKEEQVPFLGILFNSRFFPHTTPEGKELISVICGGSRYPDLILKSDAEIIEEVGNSIRSILGIEGAFEMTNLVRWNKAIPQYELGHGAIEKEITSFLSEHPNFHIAANYYKGISVSDSIKNGSSLGQTLAS